MTHIGLDGEVAVMDMHDLVGDHDAVERRHETYHTTRFTNGEHEAAFVAANLGYEHDQDGPSGRTGTR